MIRSARPPPCCSASSDLCALERQTSPIDWQRLDLIRVTHSYPREKEASNFVLGPINLTFHRGELVFLGGGNGSGKSTLAKINTGLYPPETGEIRLDGKTAYLEDRSFYLFDEWASDQDPLFKEIFYTQLLPELKARGKTVLVITHDDKYFHLADRFIKLDYGKIEQGNTDRFRIIAGRLRSLTTVQSG